MARFIPYQQNYNTVNSLSRYASLLLYSSTLISIGISMLGRYQLSPDLKDVLIPLNIFLICMYAFFDQRALYIFTQAEMQRRVDWLDNSFGTNFSGKKSTGYYTNENLDTGLKKLAVNCFENSHHTHFIVSKMTPWAIGETIIIVAIFILSAILGDREIVRLFFELALPAFLINKLVKTLFYKSKIGQVYDRFKTLFNDLKSSELSQNKIAEGLRGIIEYETTLAWASIPLESKIFHRHKEELADDWIELKKHYQID